MLFRSNAAVETAPASYLRATGKIEAPSRRDTRTPLAEGSLLGSGLDGYRIEKLIGAGSFSLVYSAVEFRSRLKVVIKEYFPKRYAKREHNNKIVPLQGNSKAHFSEGLKKFYNEALVLKKVTHPNVLDVHDLLRSNGTIYLVSVTEEGRDLKWFLSSFSGPLEQGLIYKVFMPILSALHFLHDAHLLHLDIKPPNILLQPNSKPLLLDFGAAQVMGRVSRVRRNRVVTHGFAPPEQYDTNGDLGPWTDIYGVAATMYYSITGRPLAKSKFRKIPSQLNVERYRQSYNVELLQAINRGLLYGVSERYGSIDEFAHELLRGAPWASLPEYELEVMEFDRHASLIQNAQDRLASFAA